MTEIELRPATADDVPALAELAIMAGDGLFDALYQGAIVGTPTHKIIERRILLVGTTKSYENCWVAADQQKVIAGLNAYPTDDEASDPPNVLLPVDRHYLLEPLKQLHAPGTFYLDTVAVIPEYRGQGVGTKLLSLARSHARKLGLRELSLNTFEQNTRATALYERFGFRAVMRRPAVVHELMRYSSGNILLMTCPT